MNRRDFLKAAFAGLVALVLPKGKAAVEQETLFGRPVVDWVDAPCPTVTYADVDALFNRPVVYVDGFGGFDEYDGPFYDWTKGNAWDKVELETHSTVGTLFATDEQIADWEAVGWKAWG